MQWNLATVLEALHVLHVPFRALDEPAWGFAAAALVAAAGCAWAAQRRGTHPALLACALLWLLAALWRHLAPPELDVSAPPSPWWTERWFMLLVVPPVLYLATGAAVLSRAGAARGRRALGTGLLACGVVNGASLGGAWLLEEVYPWTDWSAPHATVHVQNPERTRARLSWRFGQGGEWNPLRLPDGRDPAPWRTDASFVQMLGPIWEGVNAHVGEPVVEGDTCRVTLRLQLDGDLPVPSDVEVPLVVERDMHVRLRVERCAVHLALGREGFTGAAVFGDERRLLP